jgi:hypothetical protein
LTRDHTIDKNQGQVYVRRYPQRKHREDQTYRVKTHGVLRLYLDFELIFSKKAGNDYSGSESEILVAQDH